MKDPFFLGKLERGEMRYATAEECVERLDCSHGWHSMPLFMRSASCPQCGQRQRGWIYEAAADAAQGAA